jgi:hypothetical protein
VAFLFLFLLCLFHVVYHLHAFLCFLVIVFYPSFFLSYLFVSLSLFFLFCNHFLKVHTVLAGGLSLGMTTCAELVALRWKHLTHMFLEPPQSPLAGLYKMISYYPSAHRLAFYTHLIQNILSLVLFSFFPAFFLFFSSFFFIIGIEIIGIVKASAFSRESDGATENAMAYHVSHTGPVVACVDATKFNSYVGGVVSACGGDVNHCLQVCVFSVGKYIICLYMLVFVACLFFYIYVCNMKAGNIDYYCFSRLL